MESNSILTTKRDQVLKWNYELTLINNYQFCCRVANVRFTLNVLSVLISPVIYIYCE